MRVSGGMPSSVGSGDKLMSPIKDKLTIVNEIAKSNNPNTFHATRSEFTFAPYLYTK